MLLIFRKDRLSLRFNIKGVPLFKFVSALIVPLIPAVVIFPAIWFTQGGFGLQSEFALPILLFDRDLRPLLSSIIVGVLWTLWHIGFYQNGVLYMLAAVIAFIAISLTLYYLVREVDFNIWVASFLHFGINLASLFYISIVNQVSYMLFNAFIWVALAIFLRVRYTRRETRTTTKAQHRL
jgi:hypothetical protein